MQRDLKRLIAKGIDVYAIEEDVASRGLERADLIEGIRGVSRAALPDFFAGYERIWRW